MRRAHRSEPPDADPKGAGRSARPAKRRSSSQPAPSPPHLVRSASWAGLQAGETVRVEGVRQRSATWTFVAHVRNNRTGDEWIEVAGGRPGNHALRSFRPEQIFPAASGKGRRARQGGTAPSLADAPRLPL